MQSITPGRFPLEAAQPIPSATPAWPAMGVLIGSEGKDSGNGVGGPNSGPGRLSLSKNTTGGEPVFERVFVAGSVILSASAMAEKRDFALDGVSEGDLGLCE